MGTVTDRPTIKGIFVNSHIKAVRKQKGDAGIIRLQTLYGKALEFKNSEDVPVREEVRIIEFALDILEGEKRSASERSLRAGHLHFQNFVNTPLAKIIFPMFRKNFKLMMLKAHHVSGHVFKGVRFVSEELGESRVRVTMENNDYPIEHFQGLFQAWMDYAGLHGEVKAAETAPNRYEYLMEWK